MTGAEALENYIASADVEMPSSVSGIVDVLGHGNVSHGRSRLAELMSGTSNKSSKEYKSARRNVERYMVSEGKSPRGGKQGRANAININKAISKGIAGVSQTELVVENMRNKNLLPTVTGLVDLDGGSGDHYAIYRSVHPMGEDLTPASVYDMWDAIERGNYDEAFDALQAALFPAYDMDDAVFDDVDELDLDPQ